MPKYKLTENGNIEIKDGHPVVIGDDEKEFTVDAIGANERITALNSESAGHRRQAKENADQLAKYAGIDDPKAALDAMQTVASLDSKHKTDTEALKAAINKTWLEKEQGWESEKAKLNDSLFNATVVSKFAISEVVKNTVLPPDIAAATFGSHFNPDGTAKDSAGNQIFSKERPGEPAEFDEALQIIIDNYPAKDSILKSRIASGGGAGGTGNGAAGGAPISARDKIKAGLAAQNA